MRVLSRFRQKAFKKYVLSLPGPTLNLENSDIRDDSLYPILEVVQENQKIKKLQLGFNSITENGFLPLSEFMGEIDLRENKIGINSRKYAKNLQCTKLTLFGNPIDGQIGGFADISRLTYLNIGGCGVRDDELKYLLSNNKTIVDMDAHENLDIRGDSLIGMRLNMKLLRLNLANTGVNGESLRNIELNTTLKHLDLSNTEVCSQGCKHLIRLKSLYLSGCNINDDGAKWLSDSTSIEELDISYCKITNVGAKFLLEMPMLKKINLYGNSAVNLDANFTYIANRRFFRLDEVTDTFIKTPLNIVFSAPNERVEKLTAANLELAEKADEAEHKADETTTRWVAAEKQLVQARQELARQLEKNARLERGLAARRTAAVAGSIPRSSGSKRSLSEASHTYPTGTPQPDPEDTHKSRSPSLGK